MEPLETIMDNDQVLAYFVGKDLMPVSTQFLTPGDLGQQIGLIVCHAQHHIQPHVHLPVVREVKGTTECIVVRKGCCDIDIYNSHQQLIASRELTAGDIVLLVAGGHGFRMREDTILFEVKQGPYMGTLDKRRFNPPDLVQPNCDQH